VDTRSPATRATLASTPVADLVASPLQPLAFDLKKLASQAPTRAKDGAIVALSAQLDAMRARLREAERAAGSPAPVSSTPARADANDADDADDARRPTPPASSLPRGGARPATPPRGAARIGIGSDSTRPLSATRAGGPMTIESNDRFSWPDRAHGVALLRLEAEAREWRERLETAERREKEAREETSRRVDSARAEALASCAVDARQLEVLKYRALARGTTKLLERRARKAMAAFRLCVRQASRERRVERELVPKWNRVVKKRLAFARFVGAVETHRRARVAGERVALASILRFARRVTRAWFEVTSALGALRRRAARAKATFAARRTKRRVDETFHAWATESRARATARRRASALCARNERRRHFSLPFAAWRHETSRESEAEAHAAEMVARATSLRVFRFAGRRVRRKKRDVLFAWRAVARQRTQLRVAVARARGRWQNARGAQLVRAWHVAKRASKLCRRASARRAFEAWEARARARRFAATLASRGARNRARRGFRSAFVAWARLAAPRRVAEAEARVSAAEAKAQEARVLADRTNAAAALDREALASAAARAESLAGSLASAERRAGALAPTGGGLLETPLEWRAVLASNASVVAEMVTSPGGGAKKTRGGAAAPKPKEGDEDAETAVVGVSALLDPCPPVFIPDRDPFALDATEDGAPSTSGVAVTLLPGGETITFAALAVSTPGASSPWDVDPAARWLEAGSAERVAGAAPPGRESPAVCALPAATAAVAAAAAGSDPAGVVGGVFVYGGFDGAAEMNDAHVLLRRVSDADVRDSPELPAWEWIRVARDRSSPSPPPRSHACAFATPPPFAGSEAAREAYRTGASVRTEVYVLGGYARRSRDAAAADDEPKKSKNAAGNENGATRNNRDHLGSGLRNDLWRLDTSTFVWSCPEAIGDVPGPRRDAAVAVTPVSRSGLGRVFLHGGAAADGEPLADLYALDLGSLSWTRLPPGDQVLASDPYEAARRDPEGFKLEPEFVVALEMAEALEDGKKTSREKRREKKKNLGDDDRDRDSNNETRDAADADARKTSLRARTAYPSARSRHAATVVGSTLVVHGGCAPAPGGGADRSHAFEFDPAVYSLCLETMSWRAPKIAADEYSPAPPADRCVGHGLFAHAAGLVVVGGGAAFGGVLATPPPVFLLEMPAQREGRAMRAQAEKSAARVGSLEREKRELKKETADVSALLEQTRAAAVSLKRKGDLIAAAEKAGRDAQATLAQKLRDSRSKVAHAEALVTRANAFSALCEDRVDVAYAKMKTARRERDDALAESGDLQRAATAAELKASAALREASSREAQALAFMQARDAQDSLKTSETILKLKAELAVAKASAERLEAAKAELLADLREAEKRAGAGREALAQAEDRARFAEVSRANAIKDAAVAQRTMRREMEALEQEVARAAAGRWAADADGVGKETSRRATKTVADDVARDETGEDGSESSESSESESESMGESSDASAVDPEDLPSRLIGMLDVERPAW
jgi:hypothetical protein